jgi:hypothetical protein
MPTCSTLAAALAHLDVRPLPTRYGQAWRAAAAGLHVVGLDPPTGFELSK